MIPDSTDPRWSRVLTTDKDLTGASLATRILVARLRGEVRKAPAQLAASIAELRGFMAKNSFATADLSRF